MTRPSRPWFSTLLAVAVLLGGAGSVRAQVGHPLYACANRLAGDLRDFAGGLVDAVGTCATNRLKTAGVGDCAHDPTVTAKIDTFAATFADDMTRCSATEIQTLCSFESRDLAHLVPAVTSAAVAQSVRQRVVGLVLDLFETPYAGCARPAAKVSTSTAECADKIRTVLTDQSDALAGEYFSCELKNLANGIACVDPDAGDPNSSDLEAGIAGVLDDVSAIATRCDDAKVAGIGCPLGESTIEGVVAALQARLGDFTAKLNLEVFHASCRTDAGGTKPPLVPADATLEPSMKKVKISCGQTLGTAFFGSDKVLNLDGDLDCSPATSGTDGIVVAASGVRITGRNKAWGMTGPGSRKYRTGAGIRLAPTASNVRIQGFRKIQYFGVGVAADAAANRGLRVANSVVFRNIDAGVRSAGRRTAIVETTADRNGIGFDLSGDGSTVSRSFARRSEPQGTVVGVPTSPGVGIRMGGVDRNASGSSVRVYNSTSVTENTIGVQMVGERGSIEGIEVHSNLGDGVQVGGSWNVVRDVSVKLNGGQGVSVTGTGSLLDGVGSDENALSGFDVSGAGTTIVQCGAGSPGDKGNGLDGFHVSGAGTVFDTNRAEANALTGFAVLAPSSLFKGNKSQGNLI
ncbi:MAG: hypothetical protein ACKPBU_08025, partial [Alphaproteobacteria bacterium]